MFAGWGARRGAPPIAQLLVSAATPQTARKRHGPPGWSEIGRLNASAAGMGISPCGAAEASTHTDCAPTRPLRDRKHVLTPGKARSRPLLAKLGLLMPRLSRRASPTVGAQVDAHADQARSVSAAR